MFGIISILSDILSDAGEVLRVEGVTTPTEIISDILK